MTLHKRRILPTLKDSRGNAIIEFALTLPILLLVLFGITEFGRMIMTKNVLSTASREGARLAAVGGVADSLNVKTRVTQVLTAGKITPTAITVTYDVPGHSVTVRVTSNFVILSRSVLPVVMRGTIPLFGETVFRFEG
jgi:Flp pilus assembly protein TadG